MKPKSLKTIMIFLLAVGLFEPAIAVKVREIGWPDLVKKVTFEDPFESLAPDQLADLGLVARVRQLKAKGREIGKGTVREADEAQERMVAAGIDIDDLLALREKIRELRRQRAHAVVEGLNGQQVRMPGYALPLEFTGTKITEFLLVPWVGACIHTPPPPPNQIVYVSVKEGIESRGRFTPVWVYGEMMVKASTKDLYLVDGSAGIDIGYSLQANRVEPYKK
jgi:hypothetical protein